MTMFMDYTVEGYIGADAVLSTNKYGDKVCNFRFAYNKEFKSKDANGNDITKKVTIWHKVALWRETAQNMAPLLKKGRHILVKGDVEPSSYLDTNTNQIVNQLEVKNAKIRLLDAPPAEVEVALPWSADEAE